MTDLTTQTETNLHRNTIQYLYDISNVIPNTQAVLKSYYASKFRIVQHHTKINFEEEKTKKQSRCPRCCLKLPDTNPSYIVKPETKKSKCLRKLLRKVKNKKKLTRFQAKYLKHAEPTGNNQLVVTCNFCKKEVIYRLHKPEKVRVDVNANTPMRVNNKNRKRKDPSCGLQQNAIAAVQMQNNKTAENRISQRKAARVQRKNMKGLSKILNENLNIGKSNSGLSKFLQSLNK